MPKTPTFTMTAAEFRDWLAPVIPLAGRDDDLPVLTGVLLEARGRTVKATTTDRFRAGVCRHTIGPDDPTPGPFRVLAPAKGLKQALTLFKPDRRTVAPEKARRVKVTVKAAGLHIQAGSGDWGPWVPELTLPRIPGTYPSVEKLIRDAVTDTDKGPDLVGLNATFLSDFEAAVRDKQAAVEFRIGGGGLDARTGRTVTVTVGDHFVGLLMSRRLHASREQTITTTSNGWADLLAPTTDDAPQKKAS